MNVVLSALLAFVAVALFPASVRATEAFAERTGKACGECHVDPSGGGALTREGAAYRHEETGNVAATPPAPGRRLARFIAGFLHLSVAVLWFGTILYVHLLLKPAYAARGLPRGELFVGWISIVLIAVTGAILTVLRVPSLHALFHTRFGVLLTVKIALFLVMVTTAVIVTFVVGPKLKQRRQAGDASKKDMKAEELSRFDGKEGRPAYFAHGGVIYDATSSRLWKGGSHVGKHLAGFDLTDALRLAPHGADRFASLPVVGKLVATEAPPERPFHEKGFYFMTYLNLGLVVAVLLVIALWRWW
ncbi:MAG: CopD family protein [Deltaproteobacteria bacterium]